MGRPKKDELKLELRERNGVYYAYTSTSEWVDGKKITHTTYEGRWDPETKTVMPKRARGKYRSKQEIAESRKELTIRDILDGIESREYGSVYLLDVVQHRSRLGRDLWHAFGDAGKGILAAAMALCLHRGSFMDIEDTMSRSMICQVYGLKNSYSSQEMSYFTHQIGLSTANIDVFFESRVSQCKGVVSWDSTTIGTWAGDNGLADYLPINKDNENIPQIKKAFASDANGVPLMYELYPGTMSDIATMKEFVNRTRSYGARDVIYVMDRGYESGEGIMFLESIGARYVIPAKIQGHALKSLLTDFKKPVQKAMHFEDHNYDVWETYLALTETNRKLVDGNKAWEFNRVETDPDTGNPVVPEGAVVVKAFVCFDTVAHSDEIQNFRNMLRSISKRLDEIDCKDPLSEFKKVAGKASKYFEVVADGHRLKYSVRQNARSFKEKRSGTFIMLTPKDMSWEEMMSSYNARRLVEQNFDTDKTNNGRFGTRDPVTIQGREFIRFVSLILTCELKRELRDCNRTESVDSVLNSMAAVVAMGGNDDWHVKNICSKHRGLLEDLDIDLPSEVQTNMQIFTLDEADEVNS